MSQTIDERVVEMRFDNKQFEKNVETSLSTIEKLKQSLNFKGASKSLENVSTAAKNVNMSGLNSAVDTVHAKFSALEVMSVTALANITNSAVNAGKRIVESLTIDPVKTGFEEYETQINAVQTILANTESKGSTLKDVNAALDELNHYADLTIYNFTEMTRNIGTFTAAGVDLDTSVSAIKGIANLAAVSGSTSQQASTAMYQLSQALAAGTVKLQDWNSVVNAGMGGQVFQDALKETARVHGVAIDQMIEDEGSFRETLRNGWLTSEVLTETLSKFTGDLNEKQLKTMGYSEEQIKSIMKMGQTANDAATKVKTFTQLFDTLKEAAQSGWTQSWEIIVGDFEEAKGFLTEISDTFSNLINASSEARNKVLSEGLSSGWKQFLDAGVMDEEGLQKYITKVAKKQGIAVDELVKSTGSFENALKEGWLTTDILSESLDKLTNKTNKLSEEELESAGYTQDQVDALNSLNESVKNGSVSLDEYVDKMSKASGRENLIQSLRNIFEGIESVVVPVKEAFADIFPPITGQNVYNLTEGLRELTSHLKLSKAEAEDLKSTFKGLFAVLDIITTITGGGLKVGLKLLCKLLGLVDVDVLSVTGTIGDAIVAFHDWMFENNILAQGLKKFAAGAVAGGKAVKSWIDAFIELPIVQRNIERVENAFSRVIKGSNKYLSGGLERINAFVKRIKAMDNITLDDLDDIFIDFKTNVIDYFVDIDGGINKVKSSAKSFKDNLKQYFTETGNNLDALKDKIVTFAHTVGQKLSDNIGIGELFTIGLGAGLILLMKTVNKVIDTIGGPLGDFSRIIDGLSGVLKSYSMKIKAEALEKVAISIAILAGSLVALSRVDQKNLWSAVGALSVVAVELIALTALMGVLQKAGGAAKGSTALLGISGSLLLLAITLKQMEELDGDKLWYNIGILGILASGLTGVAAVLGKVAPSLSKGGFFFLSFTIGLKILISALDDLNDLDVSNIDETISVLLGAMAGLALVAKSSKGLKFGSAVSIIAIPLALKILVSVFEDIANLDMDKMKANIGAFVAIFGTFAGLMAVSKLAGANAAGAGVAILGMSISLILIVQAFKMMSGMDSSDLDRSLEAVSKLLLVFGAVVALSNFAGANAVKAGAMLLLMSGAILILAGVMVILSHIEPEGLDRALDAIIKLELVFAALIAVTKFAKDCKSTLIILAVTLGVLAIALGALSMIEPENLSAATDALTKVMATFAILVASTSLAKSSIGTIVVMTLVVGMLGGMLYLLSDLPIESTLAISESLSTLILSLSGACLLLSVAGSMGASAFVGIGALITLIASVGTLMAGIGALVTYVPQVQEWLSAGLPVIEQIGYGLGSFFGNIVGGFAAGATSGLPEIGTNLSDFMENAEPFFDGLKGVSADSIAGVKTLAETILILTGADLLEGITSFVTGDSSLSSFAEELKPLGEGLAAYSEAVDGNINAEAIKASATATKALAEVAEAIPNSGGKLAGFIGDNTISSFGEELKPFGEGLIAYSEAVDGNINEEAIKKSASAAKALVELADAIPNSGGIVSFFTGDNDFSTFGKKIVSFGKSLVEYSTAVGDVNPEAITSSAASAKSLVSLLQGLTNAGNAEQFSTFGSNLSTFGTYFSAFYNSINNIEASQITEIANGLKSLTSAVNAMAGLNTDDISSFSTALDSLSDVGIDTFLSTISSATPQATMAGASLMEAFAAGVKSKKGSLSSSVISAITAALGSVKGKNASMKALGASNMNDFISGIKSKSATATRTISDVLNKIVNTFESKNSKFSSSGRSVIDRFADGARARMSYAISLFSSLCSSMVSAIRSSYSSFYSAGVYVATGYINGAKSKYSAAYATGSGLAAKMQAGTKNKDETNSPSKAYYRFGGYAGMGYVNGVKAYYNKAAKAGSELAKSGQEGLSTVMSKIPDLLNGNLDYQPTISPVLDLSSVESGANRINRILTAPQSMSVQANVRAVSALMNNNQNGNDSEKLLSAIKGLHNDLLKQSGDVYNINGITYDDGSNITDAVSTLIRAAKIQRRM